MGREASWRVKMGGKKRAHTGKKAFSQHSNWAGLAFRLAARRADGLETHCESHLGLQSSRLAAVTNSRCPLIKYQSGAVVK